MITIETILKVGKKQARADLQVIPFLEIGDSIPQGDLNFTLLPEIPKVAKLVETSDLQLAPGNSKGSRHCLNSLKNVNVYRLPKPNPIQGKGLILEFTGETIITHPEHGDQLWREGIVIVTHQRQYANELKAIAD